MTVFEPVAAPAGRPPAAGAPAGEAKASHRRPWASLLSPANIGALYVLAIIVVIFSAWAPSTFPQMATVKQVLNGNAITALAALAILVPLSTATFDLSFAYTMSLAGVSAAHFVVHNHMPVAAAMVLAILVAMIIGLINGFVVVVLRVDSFIGTLGTGFLVQAFISYFSKDQPVDGAALNGTFASVSQHLFGGLELMVWWALALAVILWLFMEYTSTGRRLYAAGFNADAARLAGIRVDRLRFCSLLTSSALAGFAGVILASSISSGSYNAGDSYLLPAFAASFVGATQFKRGRMNAWGTVLAVLMIGSGVVGLTLVGKPQWTLQMFQGVVLIVALAASSLQHRSLIRGSALWRGGAGVIRLVTGRRSTGEASSGA